LKPEKLFNTLAEEVKNCSTFLSKKKQEFKCQNIPEFKIVIVANILPDFLYKRKFIILLGCLKYHFDQSHKFVFWVIRTASFSSYIPKIWNINIFWPKPNTITPKA